MTEDFESNLMQSLIQLALEEDCVHNDVTTNALLDFDRVVTARVTAKEEGVISGIRVFKAVFQTIDKEVRISVLKEDGSLVQKGDDVIVIEGKESSILKGERAALNFIQRLSGVATLTHRFVQLLTPYPVTLLDTRKTTPGMRYLEKQAVRHGGGTNHRLNLEDMAMVKDNHIKMAGGITPAVKAIKTKFPGKKIEVEVRTMTELQEALEADVYMIMLDHFDRHMQEEAVQLVQGRVKLEVSGNVTLENYKEKAVPGIDFVSSGALTHSFSSLDLSLNIED